MLYFKEVAFRRIKMIQNTTFVKKKVLEERLHLNLIKILHIISRVILLGTKYVLFLLYMEVEKTPTFIKKCWY